MASPAGCPPLADALLEVVANAGATSHASHAAPAAHAAHHAAHHASPHGHHVLLGHELLLKAPEATPGSEPALELEVTNFVAKVARLAD